MLAKINHSGYFTGFVDEKTNYILRDSEKTVEKMPLPPFHWNEAQWNGEKWEYEFRRNVKVNNFTNSCNFDLKLRAADYIFERALSFVTKRGGNKTHEKTGGVSLLIPCCGKSEYVVSTVASSANQTMKAEKIIVLLMDEKSQAMKERLENIGDNVECIVHDRMNVCAARNYLVELCPTEHFIFLDADDVLYPNYIEYVWNITDANIVFTKCHNFGVGESPYKNREGSVDRDKFFGPKDMLHQNNTALWSKTIFNDIGKYDEAFKDGSEDTDLEIRLLQSDWKIIFSERHLYKYRKASTNSLMDTDKYLNTKVPMMNKHRLFFKDSVDNHPELVVEKGWLKGFFNKEIKLDECLDIYVNDVLEFTGNWQRLYLMDKEQLILHSIANHEPIGQYNIGSKDFTVYGEIPKDVVLDSVNGFSADVIFFSTLTNMIDYNNFIIRKDALAELKKQKLKRDAIIKWLCDNYCCVCIGIENTIVPTLEETFDWYGLTMPSKAMMDKYSIEFDFKKICTFVIGKACNLNCKYCYQLKDEDRNLKLSDDEWYKRFDKMLTRAEKIYPKGVYVQLMGGEPTLWSDYLVEKIQKRLEKYNSYVVFTNGFNKKSKWFSDCKALKYLHITDWEKLQPFENDDKTVWQQKILTVTPDNVDKLESYLFLNKDILFDIVPTGCANCGEESTQCDLDDIFRIEKIVDEFYGEAEGINAFRRTYDDSGIEACQESCKNRQGITTFNCGDMMVQPCNYEQAKKYPIDEFTGVDISNCKDCRWFFV